MITAYRLRQKGVTLAELMVAMTIGLFVGGMIMGIYIGSKNSVRYEEAMSRLQENARFAMSTIEKAVRNAGYQGCGNISQFANVVNGGSGNLWLNLSSPIIGYEGGVSTFPSQISSANPVSGSDAMIVVSVDDSDNIAVINHNPTSAQIDTTQHSIQPGTILVISDCAHTAVFQMTGPTNNNNNATNIVHNTGTGVPGNCSKYLGTSCPGGVKYTFQPGASVMRLSSNSFFVAPSANTSNGNSLWTIQLGSYDSSNNVNTAPQELVTGVDNMQILYGEDTDNDGVPNRYVTADAVSSWSKVIAIQVSLLMSTLANGVSSTNQKYSYNGTSNITATDRRVRRTFTSTIALRNRSQ